MPPLLALQRQRPGTFAVLIAATCLLMMLAAALTLALRQAAQAVATASAEHMLVQVVDANPVRRDAVTDEVIARLDRAPGLISAHRVPDREALALISPYIAGVNIRDLPLPTMIELRTRDRVATTRLLASLPTVQVTGAGAELGALSRLIRALRGIAFGVMLATAAASGLIAMLSARAALAREAGTLDILHALGATDRQLSRLVTGRIARDALIGAAAGLAIGLVVLFDIRSRVAAVGAGIDSGLGSGAWLILVLLPLVLVGLAVLAAQAALLATLRRAP
jgi:cell division transport system permease protein